MLQITKREFFSNYLCKLTIYSGFPFVAYGSTTEKTSLATHFCNTKENITDSMQKTWFVKSPPNSVLAGTDFVNQNPNNALNTTTQETQTADTLKGLKTSTDIFHWGTSVLTLVQKYQQNPLRASRILSYVHVGMHDAWVLTQTSLAKDSLGSEVSAICEYAGHRAASLLLGHFYPVESTARFEAEFLYLTAKLNLSSQYQGIATKLGEYAAEQLIDRSWQDGAALVWNLKLRPKDFNGIWSPAFPLYAVNPTEGMAAQWQPWVKPNANRYVPPKASLPGSIDYQRELQQVLDVNKKLTASEMEAAKRWNLEAGSVTPAGVWFQLAKEEIRKNLTYYDKESRKPLALSVLTDLSVAMHDAFIACWAIKFRDWSERPITAIRRSLDPKFESLLVTPGFPSYVSGHATISAAAALVLIHYFPNQQKNYQLLAQEAANSRLWGGIHFDSDNKQGLLLGASVGSEVLSNKLNS
jgi:hypothetical protein